MSVVRRGDVPRRRRARRGHGGVEIAAFSAADGLPDLLLVPVFTFMQVGR